MKKVLKTILIAGMLCIVTLTMSGCGKEKEENKNQEEVANNQENTTVVSFSRGEWKDNQYRNDFAKIKFNLPEGWEKATDEEIANLMNIGVEALNEDQQKLAELSAKNTLYGMVANDPNSGANIMITLEKPTLKVTPEYYLSSVKQQLEAVESIKYTVGEAYNKDIAGNKYVVADAKVSGYPIEQSYYIRAEGDYIIGIIITTTGDGQLEEILNCFE